MDAHKNFAYSTVAVAPITATAGTALTVQTGDGAKFPTPPFNATVWITGANPLTTNAEIVRVTAIVTDVLTIVRAQESSTARTIIVGDQIAATITKATFEDLLVNPDITTGFKIGGAATSRKIIVGNGTNFVPSTETFAVPGAVNQLLTSDGTNWLSSDRLPYNTALRIYSLIGGSILAEPIAGGLANINVVVTFGTGELRFTMVYLPKAATITGVKWFQGTQGAYTAANYNGVGVYSLSAGTLTQVASSTNDGNIWKATANTVASKAFTSTAALGEGVYVIAALFCQSALTTAPTIGGFTAVANGAIHSGDYANSVKTSGFIASQTALPSPTQAMSGVSGATTQYMYFSLY